MRTPGSVLGSLLLILTISVEGSHGADLALFLQKDTFTCVTDSTSAMDFNFDSLFYYSTQSYYSSKGDDSFDCDFEDNSPCSREYSIRSEDMRIEHVGSHHIKPVTDERWESFKINFSDGGIVKNTEYKEVRRKYYSNKMIDIKHLVRNTDVVIDLSIKTKQDARIALCSGDPIEDTTECYWFLLDSGENANEQILRRCPEGLPTDYARGGTPCKPNMNDINEKIDILSEKEWQHFKLTKINNIIRLSDATNRDYMHFKETNSFKNNLKHIYFSGYGYRGGLWKLHDYKYLSILHKPGQLFIKEISTQFNTYLCVSLYAATCSECSMKISLIGTCEKNLKFETIKGQDFPTWQKVRLITYTGSCDKFQLNITTNTKDKSSEGFWVIDDIRKCEENEVRVSRINLNGKKVTHDEVKCRLLQDSSSEIKTVPANKDKYFCTNHMYAGPKCDIPCQDIFRGSDCRQQRFCRRIAPSYSTECVCTPGVHNYGSCSTHCHNGRYGFDCEHSCGYCKPMDKDTCDVFNGTCSQCQDEYEGDFCKTSTFPTLLVPPEVIDVGVHNVTLQLRNITTEGRKKARWFSILLQEKPTGSKHDSSYQDFKQNARVKITGLKKSTTYLINTILLTEDSKHHEYKSKSVLPEVTTTCSDNISFKSEEDKYHARIWLMSDEDSCSELSYYIIFKNEKKQFLKNSVLLQDLTPHTTYSVIIRNDATNYLNTINFTTKEDAPSPVQKLKSTAVTNTSANIKWSPPERPNGIIQDYVVNYKVVRHMGCSQELPQYSKTETSTTLEEITLYNLQPYTLYSITVYARNMEYSGSPINENITTQANDFMDDTEFPNITEFTPDEGKVYINWKQDCTQIKGPLRYMFETKCGNNVPCNISNVSLEASERQYVYIEGLEPYSNYTTELTIERNGHLRKPYNRPFTTKSAEPSPVRNLTVYSKTESSVSIRWKHPLPPRGVLEGYDIKISGAEAIHMLSIKYNKCDLWEDFQCFTITDLHSNRDYTIKLLAKNWNVTKTSENVISTTTVEEASEEPSEITWNYSHLRLTWAHPSISNGIIKSFNITLKPVDSELKNIKDNEYTKTKEIKQINKTYYYEIEKGIPYSTSYNVCVKAINNCCGGKCANIEIDTPPETPKFLRKPYIPSEEAVTNSTIDLVIPKVNDSTTSSSSIIYVVVCDTKVKLKNWKHGDLKQELLAVNRYLDYSLGPWIAAELKVQNDEFVYKIGDSSQTNMELLHTALTNEELTPETEYIIYIYLVNKYKSAMAYKKYETLKIRTKATHVPNYGLFFLLLLLLLPVAGFFIYRYCKKDNKSAHPSQISLTERTRNQRVSPDIIPFTSSGPILMPPRKKLIIRKPKQNVKQEEEDHHTDSEVEITEIETNMYHSRIIALEKIEDYVKEALENGELEEQFALFPKGQTKPWEYGMLKENKSKNRYNNLMAYDCTRVKLRKIKGDPYSDYINASFINGYRQTRAYIATQGPKANTIIDFWRMVWQEKVGDIIMLANVVEGGKKKCEQYWPQEGVPEKHGDVKVTFVKSEVFADYEFRYFDISCNNENRTVQQYHFTSWPDHGVPIYAQSLAAFMTIILKIPLGQAPVLVHCSAGVGRTGTIILCDICLRMAAREGAVDILRYLHELREQRTRMVDNIDQYKLVHLVLLECLTSPVTTLPCHKIADSVERLINEGVLQIQLKKLQQLSWQDKVFGAPMKTEIHIDNLIKNRFPDIIPEEGKIYLPRYPFDDEHSDYINAVPVDGFRFKNQFIVTQLPLPHTLQDFWRMMSCTNSKVLVSLNDIPLDDETCCQCWPENDSVMEFDCGISLTHTSSQNYELYDVINIILVDKQEEKKHVVNIVQFKNWKHDTKVPESAEDLITLGEEVDTLSRGKHPTTIMCLNGATACGLFVGLSFMVEKIKLEQQCDACLAIRVIRRNRKQFISDKLTINRSRKRTNMRPKDSPADCAQRRSY